jgi:hypothetical protein
VQCSTEQSRAEQSATYCASRSSSLEWVEASEPSFGRVKLTRTALPTADGRTSKSFRVKMYVCVCCVECKVDSELSCRCHRSVQSSREQAVHHMNLDASVSP